MKIALYYPWLYLTSGVERTILETVKRSRHDFTLFTNYYHKENTYPEFKKLKIVELRKIPVKRDLFSVFKAAALIAIQKIDLASYDMLLVHSEGLGDLITIRNNSIPMICFCHTPLRAVFDKYYKEIAFESRNSIGKFSYFLFANLFKIVDRFLWKRYSFVFFNSRETLRRAEEGGLIKKFNTKRYSVLHPGIDLTKIKPTWQYKPYFFLPGRIMWTKNIELGITSFLIFKANNPNLKKFNLVIAGQVDNKSKTYLTKLKIISKKRNDIKFIVSPSDANMRKYYRYCLAVLNTSFNEDWGITLLEANSFAKPVIAVSNGGPKESQVNGKTGFLVPPNIFEFADKMGYLAGNLNEVKKMGTFASDNVKKYDWRIFTHKIDNFLSRLAEL